MPWTQRIALALLTFGFAGLGLISWQSPSQATIPGEPPAYYLAISSGAGLQLSQSAARLPEKRDALSCDRVFSLGTIAIGARCVSNGWEVTVQD